MIAGRQFGVAIADGAWDAWVALSLMALAAVLAQVFLRVREHHSPDVYSPPLAWLRAAIYFALVLALSAATGVLGHLLRSPLVAPGQAADPLWLALTLAWAASVVWGYAFWWPRGTLTHGRRLYVLPAVGFGLAWGLCSGQLTLVIWALVEPAGLPRWGTALVVLFLLSGYTQLYQSGWWDIHVSPPHNLRAWNAKKVLFGHLPFMLLSLAHFTLHGNAALFVFCHALALACSAVAMRFPPFWEQDGPRVSRETALGE